MSENKKDLIIKVLENKQREEGRIPRGFLRQFAKEHGLSYENVRQIWSRHRRTVTKSVTNLSQIPPRLPVELSQKESSNTHIPTLDENLAPVKPGIIKRKAKPRRTRPRHSPLETSESPQSTLLSAQSVPGAHVTERKGPFWLDRAWFELLRPGLWSSPRDPAGNFWSPKAGWGSIHFNDRKVDERGFVWFQVTITDGVVNWREGLRGWLLRYWKDELAVEKIVGLIERQEGVCELEIRDPWGLPEGFKWVDKEGTLVLSCDHSIWRNGDLVLMGPSGKVKSTALAIVEKEMKQPIAYSQLVNLISKIASNMEAFGQGMKEHMVLIEKLQGVTEALKEAVGVVVNSKVVESSPGGEGVIIPPPLPKPEPLGGAVKPVARLEFPVGLVKRCDGCVGFLSERRYCKYLGKRVEADWGEGCLSFLKLTAASRSPMFGKVSVRSVRAMQSSTPRVEGCVMGLSEPDPRVCLTVCPGKWVGRFFCPIAEKAARKSRR